MASNVNRLVQDNFCAVSIAEVDIGTVCGLAVAVNMLIKSSVILVTLPSVVVTALTYR
jgi:hypothetical protein